MCLVVFGFFLEMGIQFFLCTRRPVPPPSAKGRQGGCINRSCGPIIVKMPTALRGDLIRAGHAERNKQSKKNRKENNRPKKVLRLPRLLEEKGANLWRGVFGAGWETICQGARFWNYPTFRLTSLFVSLRKKEMEKRRNLHVCEEGGRCKESKKQSDI